MACLFLLKCGVIKMENKKNEELIHLDSFAIKTTLEILLLDRTTNKNIIFATNNYQNYTELDEITVNALKANNAFKLQPRVLKTIEVQKNRKKGKAEVFTPSWLCNKMNNFCDEQWFERKNVFNVEDEENKTWKANKEKIKFSKKAGKTWKDYILSTRIEITCGEAPYLVSRYDTTTGEIIDIEERIGMLDRKLRVINENEKTEEEWFEWVVWAYKTTYGYEFQGDNLLIARINLMNTFVDYMKHKWNKEPSMEQLNIIATIISWNVFQMDGLKNKNPFSDIDTILMDWKHEDGPCAICFKNLGGE